MCIEIQDSRWESEQTPIWILIMWLCWKKYKKQVKWNWTDVMFKIKWSARKRLSIVVNFCIGFHLKLILPLDFFQHNYNLDQARYQQRTIGLVQCRVFLQRLLIISNHGKSISIFVEIRLWRSRQCVLISSANLVSTSIYLPLKLYWSMLIWFSLQNILQN